MQIVGICGLIGAGKTSVANIIAKHYGFRVAAFADALKAEVHSRLERTLEAHVRMCYPDAHTFKGGVPAKVRSLIYEQKDPVTRALLQEYGAEVRRMDNPGYWIERLLASIGEKDKVVIADVRFPNEYSTIMADPVVEWAAMIKVVRPGLSRQSAHISEDLATSPEYPWTVTVLNDGDLAKLEETVQAMWKTIYPEDIL